MVWLNGTSGVFAKYNNFERNNKSEYGLCCNEFACPNGGDVWNNSGLKIGLSYNEGNSTPGKGADGLAVRHARDVVVATRRPALAAGSAGAWPTPAPMCSSARHPVGKSRPRSASANFQRPPGCRPPCPGCWRPTDSVFSTSGSVTRWRRAGGLAGEHRDLFDRLIAAQALAEDLMVASTDARLDGFGVRRVRA